MIDASFSYFDAAVLGIMLLSCLFAFFRGFVKEILSLGAWVGAGLVTIYFFPDLAKQLEPRFKSPVVAAGISTLGIYIASLMAFSMINALILRFVKEGSDVGFLDNSLGLIFGAFRGAFVVSLAYLMMTMVMTEGEFPGWLKSARTRPVVEEGAIVLARAAPEYLRGISTLHDKIDDNGDGIKMPNWMKSKEKSVAKEKSDENSALYPEEVSPAR